MFCLGEQGTATVIYLNQNASVNMQEEIIINFGMKMPFIPAKQQIFLNLIISQIILWLFLVFNSKTAFIARESQD